MTDLPSRASIDARLRNWARERGVDPRIARLRLAHERLLSRLVAAAPDAWVMKGGRALDFRFGGRARPTVDVDLVLQGGERGRDGGVGAAIREACAVPTGEGFAFEVIYVRRAEDEERGGVKPPWPAFDVRVRAVYLGQRFEDLSLDISARPDSALPVDELSTDGMIGFPVVRILAVTMERQIAEKVHAMTRRYGSGRPSTRPHDLVDCVAIIRSSKVEPDRLADAARRVFEERGTHELPESLPDPEPDWSSAFRRYGGAYGLAELSAEEGMAELQAVWRWAVTRLLGPKPPRSSSSPNS